MPSLETISVAVPARNERRVASTLQSINNQDLDGQYGFEVTVVANACTDNTAERASEVIACLPQREGLSFSVEERQEPGKNGAVNSILGKSATRLFMYVDADVLLAPDCFRHVVRTLETPGVIVSGPVSRQLIHPNLLGTSLGKMHLIRQLYDEYAGYIPVPVGRMIGFHRKLLDEIPTDALADERYITLSAIRDYGWQAVQTAKGTSVYACAAQTWPDFLAVGDRIATIRQQFIQNYPQLGQILMQAVQQAQDRVPAREAVERLLVPRLIEEGIDPSLLQEWYRIKRSARPKEGLVFPDGSWMPIASTK